MHEIFREFRFESAHFLPGVPEGHKCKRVHGHSYRVTVHVRGPLQPGTNWVMDFGDLKDAVGPLVAEVDHRLLNDIEGLENPTAEALAQWFWRRLAPTLPGLCQIIVKETAHAGCIYRGPGG
ncbi:MAG: 6-carboxytetrahydropterin synthase QueD [Phycisphaeraceae bacterium]|nr:6-carboxytetrahydropterin synthase QueD [Phycisphaeraceae bacterium]